MSVIEYKLIDEMSHKHMGQVIDLFTSLGIQVWVDQGTLLGGIRDNGFIPWDWDIDLSAWHGDWIYDPKVKQAFSSAGFDFIHMKLSQSLRIEPKVKYVGWRQIDVHMYKVEGENACTWFCDFDPNGLVQTTLFKVVNRLDIWQRSLACEAPSLKLLLNQPGLAKGEFCDYPKSGMGNGLYKLLKILKHQIFMVRFNNCVRLRKVQTPLHYYQDLSFVKLLDKECLMPASTEQYLSFKYGESWKTPIKEYDWRNDGSVTSANELSASY